MASHSDVPPCVLSSRHATAIHEKEATAFAKETCDLKTDVAAVGTAVAVLEKGQSGRFPQTAEVEALTAEVEALSESMEEDEEDEFMVEADIDKAEADIKFKMKKLRISNMYKCTAFSVCQSARSRKK